MSRAGDPRYPDWVKGAATIREAMRQAGVAQPRIERHLAKRFGPEIARASAPAKHREAGQ